MAHPANAGCFHDHTSNRGILVCLSSSTLDPLYVCIFFQSVLVQNKLYWFSVYICPWLCSHHKFWQLDSSRVQSNRNTAFIFLDEYGRIQHPFNPKLGLHGYQPMEQEWRPPSPPPIWSSTAAIQQALPSLPPHRLTWESTGANITHDPPHVRSTSCSSIRSVAPLTCRAWGDHGLLSFSCE